MRPAYPNIEVKGVGEMDDKQYRHSSLDVPHVHLHNRPEVPKAKMYPSLQLDPKPSNPLTSLFSIPQKPVGFWQSLESIQKDLNDHYKIVDKMEISSSVIKILFK